MGRKIDSYNYNSDNPEDQNLLIFKRMLAAYTRVSTKHDDQKNSLLSQNQYFEYEVINKRNEYKDCEMYEVYADEGMTATKFMRKNFIRMIYDAGVDFKYEGIGRKKKITHSTKSDRKPKFSRILVSNISRLARDVMVVGILRNLAEKGVYVDFLDNGWTTEKDSDWTFIEMFFSLAANESRDRSNKVRDGLERTANRGKIFSVHNLYGYNYIKDTKELTINEEESEIVRTIFTLYADGMGTRLISKHLTDNEKYTRNGNKFEDATLRGMLKNEKYAGILYRNKWDNGKVHMHQRKLKNIEEWIRPDETDYIPPIIPLELFNQVQEIRNKKINSINKKGINTGTSEFAGLLVCGKCGSPMTRSTQYNKQKEPIYNFYLCSNKKKNGKISCDMIRIPEDWICEIFDIYNNEDINDYIGEYKLWWIEDLNILKEEFRSKINRKDQKEANRLQIMLDEISEKRKRLAKLFISGKFSEEELDEMTKEIDTEFEDIREQFLQANMSNEDIITIINDIDEVIANVHQFSVKNVSNNRELINRVKIAHVFDLEDESKEFIYLYFELTVLEKLYKIVEKYFNQEVKKTYSFAPFSIEIKKEMS